jgi:hypothetical protein
MVTKKATSKTAPAVTPGKKVTPVADEPKILSPHDIALSSNAQNAVGILSWSKFAGEADLQALINDLREQTEAVQDGDMRPVEGMLYRQAKTLETMFISLARRAPNQVGLKQFQASLSLALKAQAQCRATLEALAEIKNPRSVQFVKQANVTTGPQQVNNSFVETPSHSDMRSRAEAIQSEQNKLLEERHGNHLDTGAQGAAGRANPHMATLGQVYRASDT